MSSSNLAPNQIDINAMSHDRHRRNWQKAAAGALTQSIVTTAPITNGGNTGGGIGLSFLTSTGLILRSSALAIALLGGGGIAGSSTGLGISTALSTTAPLTGGGNISTGLTIAIPQATSTANGYLSSTDWGTFNSKLAGNTTLGTTAPLAGGGNLSTGLTLSIPQASSTANGYLSSTDWITFNSKGSGTVTSVALALPSTVFNISGSPVTTSGTLTGTFANQSSTLVFAGPTSGAAAAPTFRALSSTDIPDLAYVDSVSAGDNSVTIGGAADTPTVAAKLLATGGLSTGGSGLLVHGFQVLSADPGSPADGDAWYTSTANAVRCREKGVTLGGWFIFDGLTANGSVVANTTVKTATFTSRVLPANWWAPRAAVRCSFHGQYSNSTATTLSIDFAVSTSAGITSISGNAAFTAAAPATNANFGGTLMAMCRTTGSTGTFGLQGDYLFDNTAHTFAPAFQQPTIDTTKDWVMLVMLTWNAANVNNIAQATDCVLELCNAPY